MTLGNDKLDAAHPDLLSWLQNNTVNGSLQLPDDNDNEAELPAPDVPLQPSRLLFSCQKCQDLDCAYEQICHNAVKVD